MAVDTALMKIKEAENGKTNCSHLGVPLAQVI